MKIVSKAIVLGAFLALAACNNKTPEGENLVENAENTADALENSADNIVDSAENKADALENQADNVVDAAENKADAMADAADNAH